MGRGHCCLLTTPSACSLFETSQSLFWASFGLVDLMTFDLTGIKGFTRFWALLMFGSYSVINIIVLLNMLIAMMSNSYQIISVSRPYQLYSYSLRSYYLLILTNIVNWRPNFCNFFIKCGFS